MSRVIAARVVSSLSICPPWKYPHKIVPLAYPMSSPYNYRPKCQLWKGTRQMYTQPCWRPRWKAGTCPGENLTPYLPTPWKGDLLAPVFPISDSLFPFYAGTHDSTSYPRCRRAGIADSSPNKRPPSTADTHYMMSPSGVSTPEDRTSTRLKETWPTLTLWPGHPSAGADKV